MKQIKEGYKQTKVGIIPNEWDVVKIGEVAKVKDGTHFSPKSTSGEYKYITSKNVKFGYLDLNDISFIDEDEHKIIYKSCPVKKGDLLLTKDGAKTGNACINTIDEEFSLLSSVAFIDSLKNKLLNQFLLQQILWDKTQLRLQAEMSGQAITRLTITKINTFNIILPPLKEQEKIAEILTTWDNAIIKQQELIKSKEEQKKALMQKLLSGEVRFDGFSDEWKEVKLGEITKKMQSGGTPKADNQEYYNGNIPFVKVNDITTSGKYLTKTESFITKNGLQNSAAWIVPIDSIIYSMYASVGFLSINKIEVATSQAMINIILDLEKASLEFIYYFLLDFKKNIHIYIETGTQGNLNAQTVRNLKLKLPSLPEQQKIAEVLSLADEEINNLKNELKEQKQQKKALMQKLLTGQVRVNV